MPGVRRGLPQNATMIGTVAAAAMTISLTGVRLASAKPAVPLTLRVR